MEGKLTVPADTFAQLTESQRKNLNFRVTYGAAGETLSKIQDLRVDPQVVFEIATTVLTVARRGTGTGTILVNGQACGPECTQISLLFTAQTVVTLEAIPAPGSRFVRWETPAGEVLQGIVYENTDVTVLAVFELND